MTAPALTLDLDEVTARVAAARRAPSVWRRGRQMVSLPCDVADALVILARSSAATFADYRAECSRLVAENAPLRANNARLLDAVRFVADGMCSNGSKGCDPDSDDGLCDVCTCRLALAVTDR